MQVSALSFLDTVVFVAVAAGAYAAAVVVAGCSPPALATGLGLSALAVVVVGIVWRANIAGRKRWRANWLLGGELRQLREMLYDVLPRTVAEEMVSAAALGTSRRKCKGEKEFCE